MELEIGQKVAYPGQGVCVVESINTREIGNHPVSVGIRPIISSNECRRLIRRLSEDFEEVTCNWKTRSRAFMDKLQSGDIFATADVLKQLTYLSHEKRLSFREQTLLEKAKFLIVSEITNANLADEEKVRSDVDDRVETACTRHMRLDRAAAEH